ncbi:MAG TPA: NUDIX domain-containing protein [Clostridiales bacterium]|nr:NUDIX domain-containing protein [Clostridiales bacterium]
MEEMLPLVNEKGEVIGKAPRSLCHSDKKYLHPVVHLHVMNSKGEIYLQKRPLNKKIQPGKWDTAVGGHIAYGEDIFLSLQREAEEEIGIGDFTPEKAAEYIWESSVEREYIYSFTTVYDGPLTPNSTELDGSRFWSKTEIESNLGKGVFTPNFEKEFKKIFLK